MPLVVTPALSVSPTSTTVGGSVVLSLTGYAHGSLSTVTWVPTGTAGGGKVTACSGKTSSTGTLTCPAYRIPPTAAGNYTFTATDAAKHSANTVLAVGPSLFAAPSSGTVGTIVIVSGVAFGSTGGSSTVSVSVGWNGAAVCPSATTNLYGNFSCAFALPAASSGAHPFTATDSLHHVAVTNFTVTPSLLVTPSYSAGGTGFGPAGSTIHLTGTGLLPSASVTVSWSVGTVCSTTSSTNGGFNCSYTIPTYAPGGVYTIRASDGTNRPSVPFDVSYLVGSPATATVGSNVSITGGGFAPGAALTLTLPNGSTVSGTTSSLGAMTPVLYTVPPTAAGPYRFRAVDGTGISAAFFLTVLPSLTATPSGGPPLTNVAWSATGFAASSPISVTWTGGTACAGTTDPTGSFGCTFALPTATPGGVYPFSALDGSGHAATATFTVTYLAVLPPSGAVNSTVTFSGGGFASQVSFNVTLASSTVCTGTTTSLGGFACPPYRLGAAPTGPITFTVIDARGTSATATFTVVPQLAVRPSSASPGTRLSFAGTGYGPSLALSVDWAGGTACANTTSSLGNFSCSFVLPPTSAGPFSFLGIDADSNSARAILTVVPRLTVAPTTGPTGTVVLLNATGFAATSSLTISSPVGLACSGTTDPFGSFQCTFAVPATTRGPLTFTAIDQGSDTATATFGVAPQLLAFPLGGPVGTVVSFAGSGYAAASAVTVSWSAGTACSATTSSIGGFSCAYVLPATTAGPHTFTARDGAANSATAVFQVQSSVVASVTVGQVGAAILVNGSGFAANSTVTVVGGSSPVCSAASGTFGGFSCAGVVPAAAAGNLTVTATDAASNAALTVLRIAPSLTVAPSSGAVGANLTFRGTGFASTVSVGVAWTGGTVCGATTASNGTFACSAAMPPATAGPHEFNATDGVGNVGSTNFTVISSFSSGLTASPAGGPPGTSVTLQGTGFAAGATVNVTWANGLACSNLSDGSGSFSCRFVIPPATSGGAYSFAGSDGRGDSASASFVVTFLAVEPAAGPVGTTVTFTLGGYAASSSYTVSWSGGTACSGTTGPTGGATCTFTIPPAASGAHLFTGTDGAATHANTTFRILPVLGVSVPRGPVGTSLTFAGSAFAASSPFSLTWAGGTACSGTTDSLGNFACTFVVPPAGEGAYRFVASDGTSNSTGVVFSIVPALRATPTTGPVATNVTFTGTGYGAGAVVSVTWAGLAWCFATADASGGFNCTFAPGPRAAGPYVFTGSQGSGSPSATATFTIVPHLAVSPVQGAAGTSLTFVATGFGSAVAVRVNWSGGAACAGTTSPSGSFACSFYVPIALPGGNATFTARDVLGHSASAVFLVAPALTASPAEGGPGTTTTLSGLGFAPSSPITVTWPGGTACTTTSTSLGQFSCSFTIPLGTPGGSYPFVATDGTGTRGSTPFVVTFLTAAPTSATVGTVVTFNGGGFAPSEAFAVSWAGGTACSGTTSASGAFRCTYALPSTAYGLYVFTAQDGAGNSADANVTVTPALTVGPVSGTSGTHLTFTATGFAGGLTISVTWSSGTACSGTTNASGGFSCSFTLPSVPVGSYTFTATDAADHNASAVFDVMLPATFPVTFAASGLTAGTNWTVILNGVPITVGGISNATFNVPNGNYSFLVRAAGFVANPAAGEVRVSGSSVSVRVGFATATYPVKFAESGLAAGTSWSVTIGNTTTSSTSASLTVLEPNGTYGYVLTPIAGYTVSMPSGTFAVSSGGPPTIDFAFTQLTYSLGFNATGLPSGFGWNVSINGVTTSTNGTSLAFQLPNGTYTYLVRAVGYAATPASGSLTVNGANLATVLVSFATATYPVTWTTSGLAAGAPWTVYISSVPNHPTGTSFTINEPNGNYTWRITSAGYRVSPSSGSFSVNGASPPPIALSFTATLFTVTFNESGLPTGTPWQVSIIGGPRVNQSTVSIVFMLANGSYYVAYDAPAGYLATPASGYVNISGGDRIIQITMTPFGSLVPPPPATFLGYPAITGYFLLGTGIAAGVAVAVVLGYILGRRKTQKSKAAEFL